MIREKKKDIRVRGIVINKPGFSIFQNESITNERILLSIWCDITSKRFLIQQNEKFTPPFNSKSDAFFFSGGSYEKKNIYQREDVISSSVNYGYGSAISNICFMYARTPNGR